MGSLIRFFGKSNPFGLFSNCISCFAEGDGAGGGGGGDGAGGGAAGAGAGAGAGAAGSGAGAGGGASDFNWKANLGPDLSNSPTIQNYPDTKEGLAKAITGYLSLEKMLGGEKVPIPKGPEDTEGWSRFSKAMGIPDKATEYGLPDAEIPEGMKGMSFDKQKFAETVHAFKLTPGQAKGLWGAYTEMMKDVYGKAMKAHQDNMTQVINQMRGEWGDAYEGNVELGNLVINKFASEKDTQDWLLTTLAKDARGIRFLAKIGSQFAENKVGEFGHQRFSLSPEQAQEEINKIKNDPKHAYNNEKASQGERDQAINYVNSLYVIVNKAKG